MLGIAAQAFKRLAAHAFSNIFAAQDIKLHIKPMPKKVTFVPDVLTKLASKAVMFSVSTNNPQPLFEVSTDALLETHMKTIPLSSAMPP